MEKIARQDRHLSFFFLGPSRPSHELREPAGAVASALDVSTTTFRSALRWAEESSQTEPGLRLAGALWRFWFARGYLSEGRVV